MSSTNFRPLDDRVLVQRIEAEQKTSGGILIPDNAKEKPVEGRIIATGKGKVLENGTRIPMSVQVGETILFSKWGGTEVKVDGKDYLLLKEDDILAILDV